MNKPVKIKLLAALALVACLGLSLSGDAAAQDSKPRLLGEYFPLKVGRRWIYNLRVTAGKNTQRIEYTTKVVRAEEVEGIGPCVVTEARSIDRLFTTEFYRVHEGQLLNPQRVQGKTKANFKDRVLLSENALKALDKLDKLDKEGKTPLSWEWASADGRSKGTVALQGRVTLRLRPWGNLHCVVLKDKGAFTFKQGKTRQHQERTIWLAPGIGMVKELMQVKTDEGKVILETEALLKHYES